MTTHRKTDHSLANTAPVISSSHNPAGRHWPAISTWLSFSRIVLTPVIVVLLMIEWQYGIFFAAILFVIAAITDMLDGYFARRQGVVSTLGVYFDLTADKLLVSAVLIAMVEMRMVPAWIAMVIVAREFVIVGVRMFAAAEGMVIPAAGWGKGKTVITLAAMAAFMVREDQARGGLVRYLNGPGIIDAISNLAWWAMLLATLLTVYSAYGYMKGALPLLMAAEGRKGTTKNGKGH